MLAIKKCGGICIVQDPNEAEYPEMPLSVLNHMEADYCISLEDRKNLLNKLANDSRKRGVINIAAGHENKGKELQLHIDRLKEILFLTQESNP
jgi:hypothetical protein